MAGQALSLLVHPSGVAEVKQNESIDSDVILAHLGWQQAQSRACLGHRFLLWEVVDLENDRPANKAAETLAGEGDYFHLRGPVLITGRGMGEDVYAGLDESDITKLTLKIKAGPS